MVRRTSSVHSRASIVFEQMAKAASFAPSYEERTRFFRDEDNPYYKILDDLYSEEFALARLLDNADFVVHAEGPAAKGQSPELRAVNWLCSGVDKQLRTLAVAALSMAGNEAQTIAKKVNLRLTGFAPGSLYAGFRVSDADEDNNSSSLIPCSSDHVIESIRTAIKQMSELPKFVNDEDISDELSDYILDPAMRDASIATAFQLAPTGRIGIHSIEMSSGKMPPQKLSQRERVVLKEALKSPRMIRFNTGSFVGTVRGIDLDSKRIHLRGIPDVGNLRCVIRGYDDQQMRGLLAKTLSVTGRYEADPNGRPRLMTVDSIHVMPEPIQTQIDAN